MITVATDIIKTVVGSSSAGYTGDGGPATSATLIEPTSVVFDILGTHNNNSVSQKSLIPFSTVVQVICIYLMRANNVFEKLTYLPDLSALLPVLEWLVIMAMELRPLVPYCGFLVA